MGDAIRKTGDEQKLSSPLSVFARFLRTLVREEIKRIRRIRTQIITGQNCAEVGFDIILA